MQVPETPLTVVELDLMKRLAAYADGRATWLQHGTNVGERARLACAFLHKSVIQLIDQALGPLLDRIGAREMETFTLHDRAHGRKVAHLM